MKQIPSQFIDDAEYQKLVEIKEAKGMTWKDMLLAHIRKRVD